MLFKDIKRFSVLAKYQADLKIAVNDAGKQVQDVTLFDAFPFAEQTADLLIIGPLGPDVLKQILATGAKKVGTGRCAQINSELVLEGYGGLKANTFTRALKIGKVTLPVRETKGLDEEVDALLKQKGKDDATVRVEDFGDAVRMQFVTLQTYASPARQQELAAAWEEVEQAKAAGDNALVATKIEACKTLGKQIFEEAFGGLAQRLKRVREAPEAKDFTPAEREVFDGLIGEVKTALAGAKNRDLKPAEKALTALEEKAREFITFVQTLDQFRRRRDEFSAPDRLTNPTAGETSIIQAGKDEVDAALDEAAKSRDLQPVETVLERVEKKVQELVDERALTQALAEYQELLQELAKPASLPNPDKDEAATVQAGVKEMAAALKAAGKDGDLGPVVKASRLLEEETEKLVLRRLERDRASTALGGLETLFRNTRFGLANKDEDGIEKSIERTKINFELKNYDTVIKAAVSLSDLIDKCLAKSTKEKAAVDKARAAMLKTLNDEKARQENAVQWGDSNFVGGILADVWKATKTARTAKGGLGGIPGSYDLTTVQNAIATWGGARGGDGQVIVDLHVPGKTPQRKWLKDPARDHIQANFCSLWNGISLNVHVTVEPKSYYATHRAQENDPLMPASIRQALNN